MSDFAVDTGSTAAAESPIGDSAFTPASVLDEEQQAYVRGYLQDELRDVLEGDERKVLLERFDKWRRQRLSQPEKEKATFPWSGASNIVPPMMQQKINTSLAKFLAMFSAKRPFWDVTTAIQAMKPAAESLGKFLNILATGRFHLNLEEVNNTLFYELLTFGTEFVKVPWVFEQWKTQDVTGGERVVTVRNGPAVQPIKIEDFVTRPQWNNVQKAPWVAIRYELTHADLLERQANGIYENVELMLEQTLKEFQEGTRNELVRQGLADTAQQKFLETQLYEVFECYMRYDANKDGVAEDLVVFFERETGVILRSEPNMLGVRPIVRFIYWENPFLLYGNGLGWALEQLQDEIEYTHRARINVQQLSTLKMFRAKRGSGLADQELQPMLVLEMDDPSSDFLPIDFVDNSMNLLATEQVAQQYADKVSGVNDPVAGYSDPILKSGGGAQANMFLAQQSQTDRTSISDNIERSYSEVGMLVLLQLMANKDALGEMLSVLDPKDQALVMQVLDNPTESVPMLLQFSVQTTDIFRSEEAKRNNMLSFSQLYNIYAQQAVQYLQAMTTGQAGPEVQQLLARLLYGNTKIMEKLIETFDIGKWEDFIPDLTALNQALQGGAGGQAQGAGQFAAGPGFTGGGPVGGFGGTAGNQGGFAPSGPMAGAGSVG